MNTIVIKTSKYSPIMKRNQSLYEGYCNSTLQMSDPPATQPIVLPVEILKHKFEKILCSPLCRAQQTAKKLGKNIVVIPELKEVVFDLSQLVTPEEFAEQGSVIVRKRFVAAFIADTLTESRQQLQERIHGVMRILTLHKSGNNIAVSHSFFMKILEAELKGLQPFHKPSVIKKLITPQKRTYSFGSGFQFTLTKNASQHIQSLGYNTDQENL